MWRLVATAFGFAVFGVGGVIIPIIAVPILYILPGDSLVREKRGQKCIHLGFKSFIELMRLLRVLSYDVKGIEALRNSQLVLANHPTLLDVVFLIGLIPNANCVVKGALLKNPCMRFAIKSAGYTINSGCADDVIEQAKEAFDKGQVMIVFPEGTRSIPGESLKLKRGAANIALRADVDITPVTITCEPISLTKHAKWYNIPERPMHFTITTKSLIRADRFKQEASNSLGARALTEFLTKYFNAEVAVNDSVTK